MLYQVFADDEAIIGSVTAFIRNTDTLEVHSNDSFWNQQFQGTEIVVAETKDSSMLEKMRRLCPFSIPMVFIGEVLKENRHPILLQPETMCLGKPYTEVHFRKILSDATRTRELIDQTSLYAVGHSPAIAKLRSDLIRASLSICPVHISGETGTGKTMSARLIHTLSKVKKPLVYVNCSNLQSSLSDSDLFGHIKGAYTNASSPREGLLGEANGTTLFLDEIGDLPTDVQGKLLDVLENGTYRSMGSNQEKKTRFRLITAGKERLEELVEEKRLRQDFYYRISSLEIEVPPLRKHSEDIPDLVRHYLEEKGIEDFFRGDYATLMQGEWKGNVRELLHYLDKLSIGRTNTRE